MRHKIHKLSPMLANQIAAGEVVERPAAVVKELIENSLDAGATRIQIDIDGGGIKLIQVRDDGCGIAKDDLALALSRHATSKISELKDLHAIQSLGFRGEALASICSVSRFSITSCAEDAKQAWVATAHGKDLVSQLNPASHPIGTTVTVRDLFYNTPARRKFLRAERTEYQHIEDLVRQFILSRFHVGFILRHQQRMVFNLRPAENDAAQKQRIATTMGHPFVRDAIAVNRGTTDMSLFGWIGTAETARSSSDKQFFYVNGRITRDKLMLHAMRQAYEGLIPEGRHPLYVLFLELPADKVDVNVHPTKHEVRFHESRQVHDFICSSVHHQLAGESVSVNQQVHYQPQALQVNEASVTYQVTPMTAQAELAVAPQVASMSHYAKSTTAKRQAMMPLPKETIWGEPITIFSDQYLLAKTQNQLSVIHLTLAKRHIAYHKLTGILAGATIKSQPLLIPQTIDITQIDYATILAAIKRLQKLMIDIDTLGPNTVVIRKLPSFLRECRFKDCIQQLLRARQAQTLTKLLAENIYHPSTPLNKEEMQLLLTELATVKLHVQHTLFPHPILTYQTTDFDKLL